MNHDDVCGLADEAESLVTRWLTDAQAHRRSDGAADRLAGLLKDPQGLHFTVGFVDRVIRTEDVDAAAAALRSLPVPASLSIIDRAQLEVGAVASRVLPSLVVRAARARLRQLVGHLVIDARSAKLGKAIKRLTAEGHRLNINLLGEEVMGEAEAANRLRSTAELLARPDVDYVSLKVSSIVPHPSHWGFDTTVDQIVERLLPLYRDCGGKFINLDMEAYADLELTIAVFDKLLAHRELDAVETGIVVQAYLPDAMSAIQRISAIASDRARHGKAGVKVRLVKGANLAMEKVDAEIHGWPLATVHSKQAADTNYKRVLNWALRRENLAGLRLGVAGHNLFDIAFAHLLAGQRGVADSVEFEMLAGMAPEFAHVVSGDVGHLRLYVPVVHPDEFDVAISYLVRRLEENAAPENFMSGLFDLAVGSDVYRREAERFRASLADMERDPITPEPNRRPLPTQSIPLDDDFANEPDTDLSVRGNQLWAAGIEVDESAPADIVALDDVDSVVNQARSAAADWAARGAGERAEILNAAATILGERRSELLSAAAADTGKLFVQADSEVSEAIDFCRYYARRAAELEHVNGARFVPDEVIVVTPPWNFPVAIPTGSVTSALATGASVIMKPAHQAQRCGAAVCRALWDAGVPRDVLQLVEAAEREKGQALVSHAGVDRVILTGSYDTAKLFASWDPRRPINAETSGKNALIITPSADRDRAVWDLVSSAFGHAGQKCSAASLGILVGSVAHSQRFRNQLIDAAASMVVGWPTDLTAEVGPTVDEPSGKLLRALTELDGDEVWWQVPSTLDTTGRLWRPGIRAGVAPGSFFHLTECFGPVLGLMHAETLEEAIELQNAVDYGLTAGLHSLDVADIRLWLDRVEAGNLYVNRGITGAIVQRQPFGGWKRSVVGTGTKAGGPNYLVQLGNWAPSEFVQRGPDLELLPVVSEIVTTFDDAWLRECAVEDQRAWETEFGIDHDPSALASEANVFRYRPREVIVRAQADAPERDIARVAVAAARSGSTVVLSSAKPVSSIVATVFDRSQVCGDAEFAEALRTNQVPGVCLETGGRVRVIGDAAEEFFAVRAEHPDIALITGPVVGAARIELLYMLSEQAVSITRHRYGNIDPGLAELP